MKIVHGLYIWCLKQSLRGQIASLGSRGKCDYKGAFVQLCAFRLTRLLFIKKRAGKDGNPSGVFSLTSFPEGTSEVQSLEGGALRTCQNTVEADGMD